MYQIKNQIYQEMTKTQKSALCNFLRAFVKKSSDLSAEEILDKFLDDEKYYFDINNPHFEFLIIILMIIILSKKHCFTWKSAENITITRKNKNRSFRHRKSLKRKNETFWKKLKCQKKHLRKNSFIITTVCVKNII